MSAYYNRNPIYKANTCYCSVQEPRKNKQTKPDVDVHKNAEQQNQSITFGVCLHSRDISSILAQTQYTVCRKQKY